MNSPVFLLLLLYLLHLSICLPIRVAARSKKAPFTRATLCRATVALLCRHNWFLSHGHCSVTSAKNRLRSSTTDATTLPCMIRIQFKNGQWWENRSCTLASSCYSLSPQMNAQKKTLGASFNLLSSFKRTVLVSPQNYFVLSGERT
jgi:hypothetical protein